MTVRATYRLQFNTGFTFAQAVEIVPYLRDLGISHVYASPITVAQPGSTHGYDVIDPTTVNPELGGEDGWRSLVKALRAAGMGAIIDIVPNHMGIEGTTNGWWMDVLENGQSSPHARVFDIDWSEKLLLPVLGEPLREAIEAGSIKLEIDEDGPKIVIYGERRLPVRPKDREEVCAKGQDHYDASRPEGFDVLLELLDRQHYQLGWWRAGHDQLNWRRFFTISELAGVRIEDEAVFDATHALYFRLFRQGLIDGVRVDHIDGLTDPAGYCRRLRARFEQLAEERPPELSRRAYIVVEKILGPGERLPEDWGVDGTSGYDFMEEVAALLHDPAGEAPLSELWAEVSGRSAEFKPEELQARQDMLSWQFEGQLSSCVAAFARLAASDPASEAYTEGMLRRAIERLLWVFPVYRTYGTGADAPASDAVVRERAVMEAKPFAAPGEEPVIDLIASWLAGEGPGDSGLAAKAVRRFQQLSAPIAAKAVEDTAFYRYGRLLSRNDVGFDASRFAFSPDEFHAAMSNRAATFPSALLATATHDHKRGEDVRARIALLSEVPEQWAERTRRWDELTGKGTKGVDPADRYMLYQMLFGAWPSGLSPTDVQGLASFRDRLAGWQEKALREAALRSSWAQPDADYEARARDALAALLDPADGGVFLADLTDFIAWLRPAAEANGLVQTFLRCTVPGAPDCYQGCEFEDLSLVDPDNRSPVDYGARMKMLEAPDDSFNSRKQRLIRDLLHARSAQPDLFGQGDYRPLQVRGPRADHVLAFARHHGNWTMIAAAVLHVAQPTAGGSRPVPPAGWWSDTLIETRGGPLLAANLFADAPTFLRLNG
jgi:(1->4)-alpha-D-glucan 1-alpha-D-glucosylmutase